MERKVKPRSLPVVCPAKEYDIYSKHNRELWNYFE